VDSLLHRQSCVLIIVLVYLIVDSKLVLLNLRRNHLNQFLYKKYLFNNVLLVHNKV